MKRTSTELLNENQSETNRLSKEFFNKTSLELSKMLLGKVFVKKLATGDILKGIIVETEVYRMDDPASHSYNGRRTERNEAMFMGPGHSYVYFTYGMYHCFNISAQGKVHQQILCYHRPFQHSADIFSQIPDQLV